ncbi:uncharacterized protein B0P05DRAFT_577506 [Gilbertella persicaria]|uniref:FAR1 domain-containing protein n=1 Tax=Rhizopus stolonifer TaxID=4846 RepID=A0A367JI64_RHIST|nr:uncharacterized protein B0P05DRAFT_577506 [Gilbertella persicaria]KAI8090957.1 hypothetical protein B0P05DRAFT_577506 [Gilbertella persicaria]RCH89576.1 hypothetical protein CU098_006470 [Rhizopus stolonifer]
MEPLYERLLKKPFPDSVSAIEYCRSVCAEFGFTVKQEASANRNIYVYCSREGLPDSQRNPKPSPQRKRPSKRCDCRWRVVLSENEHEEWEFRKSMNPNASEHNHDMMSPEEMVKAWPPEVNEMIIRLARQRLQTHEIREAVKQHFPDITWNERRFYNRLTEERKRIRQRGVVERAQRLLLLSARLCSIVANHEEWAFTVESDLQRMFENFRQLARLAPENVNTLVDLEPDMIQLDYPSSNNNSPASLFVANTQRLSITNDSEDDVTAIMASPAKKRRSVKSNTDTTVIHNSKGNTAPETQKGIQMVHVPSYTIQIRSSSALHRSPPYETSANSMKRLYGESSPSSFMDTQPPPPPLPPPQAFGSSSSFFSLASPTSSSSSTSSMAFQSQRHTIVTRGITSPQQSMHSPNEFIMSQQPYQTPQPQQTQQHESSTGSHVGYTTGSNANASAATNNNNDTAYPMSFPPYTIPTSAFATTPPELPFSFEANFIPQQQRSDRLTTNQEFFNHIKEDSTQVEQQQSKTMLNQHEYEHRMHRNNNFSQQQQQNYPLPMIRSGDNNSSVEENHWS